MDISKLKTAGIVEVPQFFQFTHPAFGHPLFSDGDADGREIVGKSKAPIGFWSKHTSCMAADEFLRTRENLGQGKGFEDDAAWMQTFVASFEGLEIDGRAATVGDMLAVLNNTPEFQRQIIKSAGNLANFFGKPSA